MNVHNLMGFSHALPAGTGLKGLWLDVPVAWPPNPGIIKERRTTSLTVLSLPPEGAAL